MVSSTRGANESACSRDRTHERVVALSKTAWALDEQTFSQYFDQAALDSRRFLEELIKFARSEPRFDVAFPLIE